MNTQKHWDTVYREKPPQAVSWYAPHLDTSLALIEKVAPGYGDFIIDVGGGESTLVDDLLARGYQNVTVLDVSQTAIDVTAQRLGSASAIIRWIVADILTSELPSNTYDVWHDRATFHFLTEPEQRVAYVRQVARAVKPGGHVLVAAFGPEGPTKCSGLEVARYDAQALRAELDCAFAYWIASRNCTELHSAQRNSFSIVYAASNKLR